MKAHETFVLACSTWLFHLLVFSVDAATQARSILPESQRSLCQQANVRNLTGKFLHITDIHPDLFYKVHSSPNSACHWSKGSAGFYGAETTDCDSPQHLVDATFKWIEENLKDSIDFVVWTGDSARHDSDERHPRSEEEVLDSNKMLVYKLDQVFGNKNQSSSHGSTIPIVPTLGNNDITPHNILEKGPNKWTKHYAHVWRDYIPEEQRHQFDTGGWFYVEVIPNKLAVFSLNTMYFFANNAAVDGCASRHEPGYAQFEWLRVQLEFLRQRGLKAILTGHIPPARTDKKALWDETCWQKYALWMQQYRDVIVGSMYGHVNIEHFLLQDAHDINIDLLEDSNSRHVSRNLADDEKIIVKSATADYLMSLRKQWSKLPKTPCNLYTAMKKQKKKKRSKVQKFYDKIGGKWGERFSVSLVSPSVVPNYFPTLRVFEYNITGVEDLVVSVAADSIELDILAEDELQTKVDDDTNRNDLKTHHSRKKKKHAKKATFKIPKPPPKTSPPGPAYSPQTFSLLGYTQYFANLTTLNNDSPETAPQQQRHETQKRRDWKLADLELRRPKPHPLAFHYEVAYDTRNASDVYGLHAGLIVRSFVELAARIGAFKPEKDDERVDTFREASGGDEEGEAGFSLEDGKKHKKKKKQHRRKKLRRIVNKTWYAFVERAFVGTVDEDELHQEFGQEE